MKKNEVMAIIGGHVDEELLKRNEYLAAENEILRSKIEGRLLFTDDERRRLAVLGKNLGRKALAEIGPVFKPETILGWFRELIAKKFDSSKVPRKPGRPMIDIKIERLVLKIARENSCWGYDRIVGALANLGYKVSDQTVGNILRRYGIPPAQGRNRGMAWSDFLELHRDVIVACDFFTAEVFTSTGLSTYYVLFFIKIGKREVHVAGVTKWPNESWMKQIARNIAMDEVGFLNGSRYLLMDRDTKFCCSFRSILKSVGIKSIRLPPKSPNLNAYAERWVLSAKTECLSKLVLFGEQSLRRALRQYVIHYHQERNHQGLDNVIPFPQTFSDSGPIQRSDRLGGLLKFYHRNAA